MHNLTQIISSVIHWLYGIDFTPEISPAPKPELGEYCVNIFPIVKQAGKAPNIISEEVAKELAKQSEVFRSTSATGGYVNFFLADSVWLELFRDIVSSEQVKPGKRGTIVVDYIGANVGKPLHIGHICTPSIGQTICNVYSHLGYKVIGDSHFGDWGGIFGKLIFGWREYAKLEWEEQNFIRLSHTWVQYLLDIYQWIHNQTEMLVFQEKLKFKQKKLKKIAELNFNISLELGLIYRILKSENTMRKMSNCGKSLLPSL